MKRDPIARSYSTRHTETQVMARVDVSPLPAGDLSFAGCADELDGAGEQRLTHISVAAPRDPYREERS